MGARPSTRAPAISSGVSVGIFDRSTTDEGRDAPGGVDDVAGDEGAAVSEGGKDAV